MDKPYLGMDRNTILKAVRDSSRLGPVEKPHYCSPDWHPYG